MSSFIGIDLAQTDQPQIHRYLLGAVAPRPIGFVSTINAQGQVNLSPFSFFNVFSSYPPILIFSPARSGRDNSTKHSLQNVQEVGEAVIHVVDYTLLEQMRLSSHNYPKNVNEFTKAGLHPIKSTKVRPPRVAEAPAAFECHIERIIPLGDQGGAGNLVLCRVVWIHFKKNILSPEGLPDAHKLDLVARMGGEWYCRASGSALFPCDKIPSNPGMGMDLLPNSAKNSSVLSGNDLARLAAEAQRPSSEELAVLTRSKKYQNLSHHSQNAESLRYALHFWAKELLDRTRNKPIEFPEHIETTRIALAIVFLAN